MATLREKFDAIMANGCGYVRLNDVAGIERVTRDIHGRCNCLYLCFHGIPWEKQTRYCIDAREYSAVLIECADKIKEHFFKCACNLAIDLMHEKVT